MTQKFDTKFLVVLSVWVSCLSMRRWFLAGMNNDSITMLFVMMVTPCFRSLEIEYHLSLADTLTQSK